MTDYDANFRKVKPYRDTRLISRVFSIVFGIVLLVGTLYFLFSGKDSVAKSPVESNGVAISDISSFVKVADDLPFLEARLDSCLEDSRLFLGVTKRNMRVRVTSEESGLSGISQKRVTMNVTDAIPMGHVNEIVHHAFRRRGCEIIDGIENAPGRRITLKAGHGGFITHIITINRRVDIEPEIGYVSFLVSGFGSHSIEEIASFVEIGERFTIGIIPNQEFSEAVYERFAGTGKEIFVTLPLRRTQREANEFDIKRSMERAFRSFPGAKGATNLMQAIREHEIIAITVQEEFVDSIFFIENLTGRLTDEEKIVKQDGFLFASVDYIVDICNVETGSGIAELFECVMLSRAREPGLIIGIHANPESGEVLKSTIWLMRRMGFRLIPVGEMIRRKENWQNQQKSTDS